MEVTRAKAQAIEDQVKQHSKDIARLDSNYEGLSRQLAALTTTVQTLQNSVEALNSSVQSMLQEKPQVSVTPANSRETPQPFVNQVPCESETDHVFDKMPTPIFGDVVEVQHGFGVFNDENKENFDGEDDMSHSYNPEYMHDSSVNLEVDVKMDRLNHESCLMVRNISFPWFEAPSVAMFEILLSTDRDTYFEIDKCSFKGFDSAEIFENYTCSIVKLNAIRVVYEYRTDGIFSSGQNWGISIVALLSLDEGITPIFDPGGSLNNDKGMDVISQVEGIELSKELSYDLLHQFYSFLEYSCLVSSHLHFWWKLYIQIKQVVLQHFKNMYITVVDIYGFSFLFAGAAAVLSEFVSEHFFMISCHVSRPDLLFVGIPGVLHNSFVNQSLNAASTVISFVSLTHGSFVRLCPNSVTTLVEKIVGYLSAGSLRLASKNEVNPVVKFNYFSYHVDIEKCVRGIKNVAACFLFRDDFGFLFDPGGGVSLYGNHDMAVSELKFWFVVVVRKMSLFGSYLFYFRHYSADFIAEEIMICIDILVIWIYALIEPNEFLRKHFLLLSGLGSRPYLFSLGILVTPHSPYVDQFLNDTPCNGISIMLHVPLKLSLIQIDRVTNSGNSMEEDSTMISFVSPDHGFFVNPSPSTVDFIMATLVREFVSHMSAGSLKFASTNDEDIVDSGVFVATLRCKHKVLCLGIKKVHGLNGVPAFYCAAAAGPSAAVEVIKLFIDANGNNSVDLGISTLMYLSHSGSKTLQKLLEYEKQEGIVRTSGKKLFWILKHSLCLSSEARITYYAYCIHPLLVAYLSVTRKLTSFIYFYLMSHHKHFLKKLAGNDSSPDAYETYSQASTIFVRRWYHNVAFDDDAYISWRKRKKCLILLNYFGKSYSRYEVIYKLAGFLASWQSIISFVKTGGDPANLVKAFVLKATVQVLDLQLFAAPCITRKPLVPSFPCFANISVSLIEKPHVDIGLKLLGADLMSITGVYRLVQDISVHIHSGLLKIKKKNIQLLARLMVHCC